MTLPSEQRETVRRWISALSDGQLTDSDARQLAEILRDDCEARRLYLDHVMMEALLRREAGREAASASLKDFEPIRDRRPQQDVDEESFPPAKLVPCTAARGAARRKRFAVVWISATAAALFVAALVGYRLVAPNGDEVAVQEHCVLSGTVLVNGRATDQVPEGAEIRVGDTEAVIRLSDGSHAKFAAGSHAVLRGHVGDMRQMVELMEGNGMFQVAEGAKPFSVITSVGIVSVFGTEFCVELLPDPWHLGEGSMNAKSLLMAVVVLSGAVQVDLDRESYVLIGGVAQVYAEEGERSVPTAMGVVQTVDAEMGAITLAGRKKEGREVAPPQTFAVAPDAKVEINGQARKLADLAVGASVRLTLSADKKTVVAAQSGSRPAAEREEREKPRMSLFNGEITKADGQSVTVVRRGDSGETSQTFTISKDTQILLQTDKMEVVGKGEGGREKWRPITKAGSVADLQPGKRASVGTMGDANAIKIVVLPPPKSREGGEEERFVPTTMGVVQAVDAERGTITMAGRTKEGRGVAPPQTFAVAPSAKVEVNGQPKKLADLAAGAVVRLTLSADKKTVVAAQSGSRPAAEGGEKEKSRMSLFGGEITRVDGQSVTVVRRGDSGETSQTFTLSKDTQVLLQTDKMEVVGKGEGGEVKQRPLMEKGLLTDLEVGKRVKVETMEGATAVRIVVLPPPKPRQGGEGER